MKAIFSLIVSGALVVSGYSQTRNVLVGTNNAVVQPTNFWSADASNARTGLGLGSASTNDATEFQPSSVTLSNLAANNGATLTNLAASNIAGTLNLGQGGTGATNASNARTALGLGTAATNPASAFQASSLVLSNLTISNGGALTNITAANIVGVISGSNLPPFSFTNFSGTLTIAQGGTSATNAANARANLGSTMVGDALFIATNAAAARTAIGALATNGDATNLTNFPATLLRATGSAAGLTNFPTVALASNVTGIIAISNGGSGATTAGGARTNFGLGVTNAVQFGSLSVADGDLYFGISGEIGWSGETRYEPETQTFHGDVYFNDSSLTIVGSNAAQNIAITRTNFGLGATWLTNTNVTNFRTAIGLGTNAQPVFDGALITGDLFAGSLEVASGSNSTAVTANGIEFTGGSAATTRTNLGLAWSGLTNTSAATFRSALEMGTTNTLTIAGIVSQNITVTAGGGITLQSTLTNDASFRTNIGLGWSALTNTNAGTSLVSVNTNGDVVSPTNFWQRAPIQTTVQDFTGITVNQTNNATNARNVYIYSLATNVSGISNTIILPTNASTFNGDEVCVVHKGTTNTTTVVRQAGSTNNLITLNKFDESVKFIRELGQWGFYHNISFIEPIQFSGTNVSANAAASRTNLGLGATNDIIFNSVQLGTNDPILSVDNQGLFIESTNTNTGSAVINFIGDGAEKMAANTRTNLGLGLPALTNTNNAKFQEAIFTTNATPTNSANVNSVGFNTAVAWMAVNIITNGVTNTFHVPLFK